MTLPAIAAISLSCLFAFYAYRKFYKHRVFKDLGIPGPEPHWLWGNTLDLRVANRHEKTRDWSRQYGSYFGFYYGGNAVLAISDPAMIEAVGVKQHSVYQGHSLNPLFPNSEKDPNGLWNTMLFSQGERWKKLRTSGNAAFTPAKLKSYMSLVSRSQGDLMELFEKKAQSGENFDCRTAFQLLTLDVIGESLFSIKFDAIKTQGEGNGLLKSVRRLIATSSDEPLIFTIGNIFTEFEFLLRAFLKLVLNTIPVGQIKNVVDMYYNIEAAVRQRKAESGSRNDILGTIMANSDAAPPSKALSERELVQQCIIVFNAGYETTSNSISYMTYLLASHPRVQEKLAQDLAKAFPRGPDGEFPEISYDIIMNELPYLDWVAQETLRLYPVGMNALGRYVLSESAICGVPVPTSIHTIWMDTWALHTSPELWGPVDPETFHPERFSPENSVNRPDAAYVPFGLGPHLCLGKRLALLEMKLTIANVLLRYKLLEPDGGYPGGKLQVTSLSGPFTPINGVPIRIARR